MLDARERSSDASAPPAVLVAALPTAHAWTVGAVMLSRDGRTLDLDRLAGSLDRNRRGALDALDTAEDAFFAVFGHHLLSPHRPWVEDAGALDAGGTGDDAPRSVRLADAFVDLLDRAHAHVRPAEPAPAVGGDVATWIAVMAAAQAEGAGLHLGLRCRGDGARDKRDLAALLCEAGVVAVAVEGFGRALAAGLLRAEMHAGGRPAVVVVSEERLVDGATGDEPDPAQASTWRASAFALEALPWLKAMRGVCVWCLPHDVVPPPALDGLIAGCLGPIRPEVAWTRTHLAVAIGHGVGAAGVAALAGCLEDPRDAKARATAARVLHATGMGIDEACGAVARSLVPMQGRAARAPDVDLELFYADGEIELLCARAREVALAGGRVLFHGPPGGGKSSLAAHLAARMEASGAAGPAVVVDAASILVRPYGGTERLLAQLWRRAEIARSPIVVDELDAMCGVRDPAGGSSGNAYLVRVLTDEWLRRFDAHPGVPVLATVNDPKAVDPAALRRFTSHHFVGGDLPPRLERRAWATILGMDPPLRWAPCGASPSDFASAKARCRMLGLEDAASLAARGRQGLRRAARPAASDPQGGGVDPLSAPRTVEVLVAARDGGGRHACAAGLSIVHVDAVEDARAALAALNGRPYVGGACLDARPHQTASSAGRDVWRAVALTGDGMAAHAPGVRLLHGRILVVLPDDVPLARFRKHLRGALHRLHLHRRKAGDGTACLRPRNGARADLYAVDPVEDAGRLFWIVATARLSAAGPRRRRRS